MESEKTTQGYCFLKVSNAAAAREGWKTPRKDEERNPKILRLLLEEDRKYRKGVWLPLHRFIESMSVGLFREGFGFEVRVSILEKGKRERGDRIWENFPSCCGREEVEGKELHRE